MSERRRNIRAFAGASAFWLVFGFALWHDVLAEVILVILVGVLLAIAFGFSVFVADALLNPARSNRYEDEGGAWWEP